MWKGGKTNYDWLEARANWARYSRPFCQKSFDYPTEARLKKALKLGANVGSPQLQRALREWEHAQTLCQPPETATLWFSTEVLDRVVGHVKASEKPVILWRRSTAVHEYLSKFFSAYGAGEAPEPGSEGHMVLSLSSHKEGLNLQQNHWCNFVLEPPSSAQVWEQFLGRTHRSKQRRTVVCDVLNVDPSYERSVIKARGLAAYMESTGQAPRLLLADYGGGWFDDSERPVK